MGWTGGAVDGGKSCPGSAPGFLGILSKSFNQLPHLKLLKFLSARALVLLPSGMGQRWDKLCHRRAVLGVPTEPAPRGTPQVMLARLDLGWSPKRRQS